VLRLLKDDEPAPSIPALYQVLATAIDRTYGAEIRSLRAQVETLSERLHAFEEGNGPTDLYGYRLRREGVMPFVLDDAERRLSEGIELSVIAEDHGITPEELHRQLLIRQEWLRRHAIRTTGRG
jgi:hypothetical protein